jgi:hypothetical protein
VAALPAADGATLLHSALHVDWNAEEKLKGITVNY